MASYWDLHGEAVASWALQDSTGVTAADDAGTHPSSLVGGFSFDNNSAAGPRTWLPSALEFDGVDDYISIPSPATLALGAEHSLSVWFRAQSSQPWPDHGLVELGGVVHSTTLVLEGSSVHLFAVHDNSVHTASVVVPDDGAWHHVVAVHRSTLVEVYLDGVLAHTSTMAQPWMADGGDTGALGAVDGGRWITGSDFFVVDAYLSGALAGVMLFQRALLASEVAELRAGPEPTLAMPLEIPAVIRAGDRISLDPDPWDEHQNGSLATTTVLQSSSDGATGWADLESTRDCSPPIVPLTVIGQFVRLESVATNDGGESDEAYSSSVVVLSARDPAALEAGAVRFPLCEVGVAASGGCQVGKLLPGQGENE